MSFQTDDAAVNGSGGLFVDPSTGEVLGELPERTPKEERGRIAPNSRFVQMYPQGLKALRELCGNKNTMGVFLFLIETAGHDNAVSCTLDVIADEVEVSTRTVKRAIASLKESRHLRVLKLGTANVYVLNEAEFWKTAVEYKRFCAFSKTKVLVSKKENKAMKQRLTHYVQPELFDETVQ